MTKKTSPTSKQRSFWSMARALREQRNAYAREFAEKHSLRYEDGTEAKPGDVLEDVTLVSILPPKRPGSTGRVIVAEANGQQISYFPAVLGAHWEPR